MHRQMRSSWFAGSVLAIASFLAYVSCTSDSPNEESDGRRAEPTATFGPMRGLIDAHTPSGFEFLSFREIEEIVGFPVLSADEDVYRYEDLNRELTEKDGDYTYYELYSLLDRPDQTTLTSVTQAPIRVSEEYSMTFDGQPAIFEERSGRFELRFLTGAMDSSGVPIGAVVVGPSESTVRKLLSNLAFRD
jgi:hypothetical protein